MVHGSVFSGIGGPEVAAEMLGWENAFHCEINPFGRKVLDYWFPKAKSYEDITKTDFSEWRGKIDVLTGGFPCQPFSYAGKRRGSEDDRYLWPFMLKCIHEIRPTWFVGENVAGITTMVFPGEDVKMAEGGGIFDETNIFRRDERYVIEEICQNLESEGYSVQPFIIPACGVGAPHRRDRVFFVAHLDAWNTYSSEQFKREKQGMAEGNKSAYTSGICKQDCERGISVSASDTDCRNDERGESGEHESESGEERLSERNEVREPVITTDVRSEMCRLIEDSLYNGCSFGQDEDKRDIRHIGNVGAGDYKRICKEERTDVTNTNSTGQSASDREDRREWEKMDGECQSESFDGIIRPCESSIEDNDADTFGKRLERQDEPRSDKRKEWMHLWRDLAGYGGQDIERLLPENRWRNFPTVSPVHRGNDGIPFNVDCLSISFSRWRTESLKAYGNAIVPQVMYEIFRAIEITENK